MKANLLFVKEYIKWVINLQKTYGGWRLDIAHVTLGETTREMITWETTCHIFMRYVQIPNVDVDINAKILTLQKCQRRLNLKRIITKINRSNYKYEVGREKRSEEPRGERPSERDILQ